MSFLQVCILERDGRQSGAEIRNATNFINLSTVDFSACFVFPAGAGKKRNSTCASTVAALDADRIALLVDAIRRQRPSCVVFEGVGLLQAVEAVRAVFPALRMIVDFHNVESALLGDVLAARLPRPLRALARLIWAKRLAAARAADRKVAGLAGEIWVCSDQDRAAVRALGINEPVTIVSNPVPQWCSDRLETPHARSQDVLFVGHLRYAPNRRAVHELCRAIMPRLTRRVPGAGLHVCGRSPNSRLKRLLHAAGHRLSENPVDLRPAYAGAKVTAMPLREGGGTRIKVLEALAVGCPIVATPKAVEGLGLEDGKHYLEARSSRDFASALEAVLTRLDLAERLASAGKALVDERFGPDARLRAVRDALRTG